MYRIESQIDPESAEFFEKKQHYLDLLKVYCERIMEVRKGGSPSSVEQDKKRGKLHARERIALLIDPNTPFFELSSLATWGAFEGQFPSAGIVIGIAIIHGRETMLVANDVSVKGGTYVAETIKKHVPAQEIAIENHLPCVYMIDSGGVFLAEQSKVFADRFDFGRFFYNQSKLSALGVPQIAIVMGSCTVGGAAVPAMSDETIIVKKQGIIFIGGPHL